MLAPTILPPFRLIQQIQGKPLWSGEKIDIFSGEGKPKWPPSQQYKTENQPLLRLDPLPSLAAGARRHPANDTPCKWRLRSFKDKDPPVAWVTVGKAWLGENLGFSDSVTAMIMRLWQLTALLYLISADVKKFIAANWIWSDQVWEQFSWKLEYFTSDQSNLMFGGIHEKLVGNVSIKQCLFEKFPSEKYLFEKFQKCLSHLIALPQCAPWANLHLDIFIFIFIAIIINSIIINIITIDHLDIFIIIFDEPPA